MAIVFVEGFDHYAVGLMTVKGWSNNASSFTTGRVSGSAARQNNSTTANSWYYTLPAGYSTVYLGAAIRAGSVGSGQTTLGLKAAGGSTLVVGLRFDASGHFILVNSAGTLLCTGTTIALTNTWYYIEIKVVVSATVGAVELRVNGISEATASTVNTGATNVQTVAINSGSALGNVDYDDMWASDSGFQGDCRVQTIYPDGAGNSTAWTPDTGSNFARVNEASADGDPSYVASSTATQEDTYTMGNITPTSGTIIAVQAVSYVRKDDAGSRSIANVVRLSGTETTGATQAVQDTYSFKKDILETKPGGGAWSVSDVNSMESGVKLIA